MSGDITFGLDVAAWVEKAKGNCDEAFRGVAKEAFHRVVDRTPVASGAARGGWVAGVNDLPQGVETPLDPDGAATIAKINAVVDTAKVGDVVAIVNQTDHAGKLEYGYSKKAPAGMVRITIMETESIAREVSAKLEK